MPRIPRSFAAAAAVVASAVTAAAQSPLSPFPGTGVPVGRPVLTSVGTKIPQAGTTAGQPIGLLGLDGKPISMERPQGQVVDLKNLAAPLSAPLTPGLADSQPKSVFEQVYQKWREAIGLSKPASLAPPGNYTPGLSRRNRERRAAMWWRD
jgi:hypothetical protein